MNPRQAVLLAGGRGTRMWPLTATLPKGLLPVAGVPFVDLQITQLRRAGIEEVFLAVGRSQLQDWESFAAQRPEVHLLVEDMPLDTAGPVVASLDRLDERFAVLNGDVVIEADLAKLFDADDPASDGTLGLVEVDDTSAYGVVVLDAEGRVERFVEKPSPAEAPANTANAGMYVLARDALASRDPGPLSFERVVFPELAAAGRLRGVVVEGRWLDIGTPDLYLDCTGAVLQGATSIVEPVAAHLVEGECSGTVGGDWCWIADGASVGAGADIEDAIVLPGASIGAGASVQRAIVGWDATVGEGARVSGASIIGSGAVIGAGVEVDNGARVGPSARLDEGSIRFTPPE